jgi:glycosyltransferase involved in cell wall biosynthesis
VQASLLLVGDGPDEGRYRARAATLPNVVFTGFVQEPELPRWYHLADAFIFPTLGDPYGHVVQEAMAAGLPVVATDQAGDISERVIDGETGFIVPAASGIELERRMTILASDAALRTRMGRSGFERIQPRTVEWWAGEFERLVERTLSGKRGARLPDGASRGR